jgi:hypothetical protein
MSFSVIQQTILLLSGGGGGGGEIAFALVSEKKPLYGK